MITLLARAVARALSMREYLVFCVEPATVTLTPVSGLANATRELRTLKSLASSLELPGANSTERVDELVAGVVGDGLAVGVGVSVAVAVGSEVVGAGLPFWFEEPLVPEPAARNVATVLTD